MGKSKKLVLILKFKQKEKKQLDKQSVKKRERKSKIALNKQTNANRRKISTFKMKKHVLNSEKIKGSKSCCKEFGWKVVRGGRPYQEDRIVHKTNFRGNKDEGFFAVYDGHGGDEVSQAVKENFHKFFKKGLKKKKTVKTAYKYAHMKMDEYIEDECEERPGSTSASAYIADVVKDDGKKQKMLFCANAGDSRIVHERNGLVTRMTKDHKPSDRKEKARIEALGGEVVKRRTVYRVEGLAVSRSFGDMRARPYITSTPHYKKKQLKKGDKIILASDGIWDVISDFKAFDIIKKGKTAKEMAKILQKEAKRLGSRDNISVIVILV